MAPMLSVGGCIESDVGESDSDDDDDEVTCARKMQYHRTLRDYRPLARRFVGQH